MNNIAELKEKIEKDYKDMMAVINSTSLPLFVEDTIEDMHILIKTLIAENKELKEKELDYTTVYLNGVYDEREKWQKKIKEMKERNKRQQENLKIANKKIAAQRGQLMMLNKAYIPKSKVKDEISYLRQKYDLEEDYINYETVIEILQELLED